MMQKGFAERFAKEWVAAWNSHDLERVLEHYEDDFEMSSPIIVTMMGEASGKLKGKAAVGRLLGEGAESAARRALQASSGARRAAFAHYVEWSA